jgi:hypothetical protein
VVIYEPIATAPVDGTFIRVRTKSGAEFVAGYMVDGFIDADGRTCGSWAARDLGGHPPSWTGGVCWECNEHGVASDTPVEWALPP